MQPIDMTRFDHLSLPGANPLGIGMRADDPIAANETITNELIRDMPLITSTARTSAAICPDGSRKARRSTSSPT